MERVNIEITFARRLSKLSGVRAFSVPKKMWGSVDCDKDYKIIIKPI